MNWFQRWYGRRLVNVNVNIVLAGALALGITVLVMNQFERLGLGQRINGRLGIGEKFVINGVTFVVDLVADVLVYYALHWLANHFPSRSKLINPAYANLSFMKDATLVQFERAALSPILYVIALGGQHWLLHLGHSIAQSTAIGFASGILTTRIIHTLWMFLQEKRTIRKSGLASRREIEAASGIARATSDHSQACAESRAS